MTDAIAHRGPDGEGIVARRGRGRVPRASPARDRRPRRRRAADVDRRRRRSASSSTARSTTTLELRAELDALGHAFRHRSLRHRGAAPRLPRSGATDFVARLNGMWAFVALRPRARAACSAAATASARSRSTTRCSRARSSSPPSSPRCAQHPRVPTRDLDARPRRSTSPTATSPRRTTHPTRACASCPAATRLTFDLADARSCASRSTGTS